MQKLKFILRAFDGGGASVGEVRSLRRGIQIHAPVRVARQELQRNLAQKRDEVQRIQRKVDFPGAKAWAAKTATEAADDGTSKAPALSASEGGTVMTVVTRG